MLVLVSSLGIFLLGWIWSAGRQRRHALERRIQLLEAENELLRDLTARSAREVYLALRELHPSLPEFAESSLASFRTPDERGAAHLKARLDVIRKLPDNGPSQIKKLKELARELIVKEHFSAASEIIDLLPSQAAGRIKLLKDLESAIANASH